MALLKAIGLGLVLASLLPGSARAQASVSDPEVLRGMREVDNGEYDAAILTLDAAARRLAADPAKSADLSQAYLYLGIAYLGKGHEAAAKAKFREAVSRIKTLTLSPDKFPPKVINLFEAAKEEESRRPQTTATLPKKDGGSKKWLWIGGGAAVVGGGAAALALRKEEDPNDYGYFEGVLTVARTAQQFQSGPGGAGHWKAELKWQVAGATLTLQVHDATTGAFVTEGRLANTMLIHAEWDAQSGASYRFDVGLVNNAPDTKFELSIQFPKP